MKVAPISEDTVTQTIVYAFLDLVHERKVAGRRELAATMVTIASWLSERTNLNVQPRHVQTLVATMNQAQLITIGGGGIGRPNTYDTTEDKMGTEQFWNQVDALLAVWQHPSRQAMVMNAG
jgi:hypothetical protein